MKTRESKVRENIKGSIAKREQPNYGPGRTRRPPKLICSTYFYLTIRHCVSHPLPPSTLRLGIGVLLDNAASPSLNEHFGFAINLSDCGVASSLNILVDCLSRFGNSVAGENGLMIALAEKVSVDEGGE